MSLEIPPRSSLFATRTRPLRPPFSSHAWLASVDSIVSQVVAPGTNAVIQGEIFAFPPEVGS